MYMNIRPPPLHKQAKSAPLRTVAGGRYLYLHLYGELYISISIYLSIFIYVYI